MGRSKKEIDKELMYKKLMPSGKKTMKPILNDETQKVCVQSEKSITGSTVKTPESPISFHRALMRREVGIPTMDTQQTILVNAMESVVIEKLEQALTRFQCCKCDRCKKDIVALALNKLEPRYMVLYKGQPTPDIDTQTNAQVVTAVIKAILAVRANPRH